MENNYLYKVGTWSSVLINQVPIFEGRPLRGVPVPLYPFLLSSLSPYALLSPLLYSPSITLVSHPQSPQGQILGGLGNHLPDIPLQSGTGGPHCALSDEGTLGVCFNHV